VTDAPTILYIVSRFPTVTETFVVNEWWKLGDRFRLEFASLLAQREEVLHEPTRRLLPLVTWVGLLAPATVRANLALALRRPRLYFATLLELQRGSARTPMGGHLKGAFTFWKAVRLAELARARGARHVHAHFANQPATAAWVIHRLTGIPFSFTAHANDLFLGPALLDRKLREAAFAATISEYNVAFMRRLVPGEHRVEVVHCGIEPSDFPFRERGPVQTLLCVARLADTKGHADLLRAFALVAPDLPRLRLRLVGDGPERARLQVLARELGIERRVDFLGSLGAARVTSLMAESDLFVLAAIPHPSGAMDGIPVALMEAMSSGLPVLTTELSGIPELVEDGRTGLLVRPGDVPALADGIRRLVEDRDLRERLAANARQHVVERFSLTAEAERLGDLFAESVFGTRRSLTVA
jgi:colanic acid/amylovoran biosynthesis glycosyltransferase